MEVWTSVQSSTTSTGGRVATGSGRSALIIVEGYRLLHIIFDCGPIAFLSIIEYGSTLYVGLQLKQNGRPYKAMVRTVSKSRKGAFLKLQKVSSLHYHAFL